MTIELSGSIDVFPPPHGHRTAEEIFAPCVQKGAYQANQIKLWNLSLDQKLPISKVWILPLLTLPCKVAFLPPSVISSLYHIYNTALSISGWTIRHDIMALPLNQGGYSLAPKKVPAVATCLSFCAMHE